MQELGEDASENNSNTISSTTEDSGSRSTLEQSMQQTALAAKKAEEKAVASHDKAMQEHEEARAAALKDETRVTKLEVEVERATREHAGVSPGPNTTDLVALHRHISETHADAVSARQAAKDAWQNVIETEDNVYTARQKRIKAETVLRLKQLDNNILSAEKNLESTQKKSANYKAATTKAVAELNDLEQKEKDLRDKENNALAAQSSAQMEFEEAQSAGKIAEDQLTAARTRVRQAIVRKERLKQEKSTWDTRLKAARWESGAGKAPTEDEKKMLIKIREAGEGMDNAESTRKMGIKERMQAFKDKIAAKKTKAAALVRVNKATVVATQARTAWKEANEAVRHSLQARDASAAERMTIRNAAYQAELNILHIKGQKNNQMAKENRDLMASKQDGAQIAVKQDEMGLQDLGENLAHAKKNHIRDQVIMPTFVRKAAMADAKAKASQMGYSAAWVRVFKMKKELQRTEEISKNARHVADLHMREVARLTDQLKKTSAKESKAAELLGESKNSSNPSLSVVEQIAENAERAKVDMSKFNLQKATNKLKKARKQADEYAHDAADAARNIENSKVDAQNMQRKYNETELAAKGAEDELTDMVLRDSNASSYIIVMSAEARKLKVALAKHKQRFEDIVEASKRLAHEEAQTKEQQEANTVKLEAQKATETARASSDRVETLQQEIAKLKSQLNNLMDKRADYHARADLADRADEKARLRVAMDRHKKAAAAKQKADAESAKIESDNARSRLLGESANSVGAAKERLDFLAVQNDEKAVAAKQDMSDAQQEIATVSLSEKRDMMSASAYAREGAILRSSEKSFRDQEEEIQAQISMLQKRVHTEQASAESLHIKGDVLQARALKMKQAVDESEYQGREKEANDRLARTRKRRQGLEMELTKLEDKLGLAQVALTQYRGREKQSAAALAADDQRQKSTIMAEADATWAEQQDKKRRLLDEKELQEIRKDAVNQEMKLAGLKKQEAAINKKLQRIDIDMESARDAELKARDQVFLQHRLVNSAEVQLQMAQYKAKKLVKSEKHYLKTEKVVLDASRKRHDEVLERMMSGEDKGLMVKLKKAESARADAIEGEQLTLTAWTGADKDLAMMKNRTEAHIEKLKNDVPEANKAYVSAAAMAIGVARYTSEDKLNTERRLEELSQDKMDRIKSEAESLTAPIKRLDHLKSVATGDVAELEDQLSIVALSNRKANSTMSRRIKDIVLAKTKTLKQYTTGTALQKSQMPLIEQLAAKKIEQVKEEAAPFLHVHEQKKLTAKLLAAKKHLTDVTARLDARQKHLQGLASASQATSIQNSALEKHTANLAQAVIDQAFQNAGHAERTKDKAIRRYQLHKHDVAKLMQPLQKVVKDAKKAYEAKKAAVVKATEEYKKILTVVDKRKAFVMMQIKKEEDAEVDAEDKDLKGKLSEAEMAARKLTRPQRKGLKMAEFKLKEDIEKERKTHQVIWGLQQDLAKHRIEKDEFPREEKEAQMELSRDSTKMKILAHSQVQAAGAVVGAKKAVKKFATNADLLEKLEIEDRMQLHKLMQKQQKTLLGEDVDAKDITLAHNQIRNLQAQTLKDYSKSLLAGVAERRARLAAKTAVLVATAHEEESKSNGLWGKAEAAAEAVNVAEQKAVGLEQEASTRAAKVAVAVYAARSLKAAASDYQVLAKQSKAEVDAIKARMSHNDLEIKGIADTIQGEMQRKSSDLSSLRDKLATRKSRRSLLKALVHQKIDDAHRVLAVADKAEEKAEWMKKVVVVKRLQYLASKRWAMMAEKEAMMQGQLATESFEGARSSAHALTLAKRDSELLQAKSASLAVGAKINVLKEALAQAVAARRKVESNLAKQHKRLKEETQRFTTMSRSVEQKADAAQNMFKMAETMRTKQYNAKTADANLKAAAEAQKWEKQLDLAKREQTQLEVSMAGVQVQQRSTAQAIMTAATLLGSLAKQEFRTQKSLQDSMLAQKGADLMSQEHTLEIMKKYRTDWTSKFKQAQKKEAETVALQHKAYAQAIQAATLARGETRLAKMAVRSERILLSRKQQAHQQALSSTEKARFHLETLRSNLKDAEDRSAEEATSDNVKVSAATKLVDKRSHEALESTKSMLRTKSLVDKAQEQRILKQEIARQADMKADKAKKREIHAQQQWDYATVHLQRLEGSNTAEEHKGHDVKAGIYVELLSHKEAMAEAKAQVAVQNYNKVSALRFAAMHVLEVDLAVARHMASDFKELKRNEASMRRKATEAEKRGKKLTSAKVKAAKLIKAEEKAEGKAQMKEFKDARNKLVHSKNNVTMNQVDVDTEELSKDNEKLAVAKAMQNAVRKEVSVMKRQEREAFSAATRFQMAATAQRALFPHFTTQVKEKTKAAAASRAVLKDLNGKYATALKAAKISHEVFESTKQAQLDGKQHWEKLQSCAKVNSVAAERAHLRNTMKTAVGAAHKYQEKARYFKSVSDSNKSEEAAAHKHVREARTAVTQIHRELFQVAAQADKAFRKEEIRKEERNSWAAEASNALDFAAKAMLKARTKGAEEELGEAAKQTEKMHEKSSTVEERLNEAERTLESASRKEFGHHARSVAATSEYESYEAKATRESNYGEKLQVLVDNLGDPMPIRKAECDDDGTTSVHLSVAWKKEMLRNLVAFYLKKNGHEPHGPGYLPEVKGKPEYYPKEDPKKKEKADGVAS